MKLMNTIGKTMAVLAVAGLTIAPIASADPPRGGGSRDHGGYDRGRGGDRGDRHDYRGGDRHDYRGDRHDGWRGNDRRDYYRRPPPPPPRYAYRPVPHRYYAPPPRYSGYVTYGYATGPYFSAGYISPYRIGGYYRVQPRTVYITNYAHYGLYAPPPGYYWVRDYDRGDAILASMATGAIIGLVVGAIAYN